ncbi:MAG TPA: Imm52 family immunity protein [Aliidongia sp.]|nr:Imm52 family immunity protein [Aliidongia sp.]
MKIGQYTINSCWVPRSETEDSLSFRCLKMARSLSSVNSVFGPWHFLSEACQVPQPLEQIREQLPNLISHSPVDRTDEGKPFIPYGYIFHIGNSDETNPRAVTVNMFVGATATPGYVNHVSLHTADPYNEFTDSDIVTYDIFRGAMLAIARAWDVSWCAAYPTELRTLSASHAKFHAAWMTYVAPRFEPLIQPPASLESERLTDGGLLMVATRDRFDVANPAHLAAAEEIEAALAPLNALSWPPEEDYP